MNGVICSVSNPDVYYEETPDGLKEHSRTAEMFHGNPGEDFQCRCSMVAWDPEIDGMYEVKNPEAEAETKRKAEEEAKRKAEEEAKAEETANIPDIEKRLKDLRSSLTRVSAEKDDATNLLHRRQVKNGAVSDEELERAQKEDEHARDAVRAFLSKNPGKKVPSNLMNRSIVAGSNLRRLKKQRDADPPLPPSELESVIKELKSKIERLEREERQIEEEIEAKEKLFKKLRREYREALPEYQKAMREFEAKVGRKVLSRDEALDDMADILNSIKGRLNKDKYEPVRKAIFRKTGSDGLPTVVSAEEFEKLAAEGGMPLYRGLKEPKDGSKSARQVADELRDGPLWAGKSGGVRFGSGIYFTNSRDEAEGYGKAALVEAMIKPGAKEVKYEDIEREWLDSQSSLRSRMKGVSDKEFKSIIDNEIVDVGEFAALKGYDVILKESPYFDGVDYYVILDRRCLAIKE